MNINLKLLTIALLTIGVSTPLLAQQTGNPITRPGTPVLVKPSKPGKLDGFLAVPAEVDAGQPLTFKFGGTGHCKISVNTGNALVTEFEGELPFNAPYIYTTASMSSFESFKVYTANATPQDTCKLSGAPKFMDVRVNNPTPQGLATPPSTAIFTVDSNSALTVKGGKPYAPAVPATIKSIVLTTTTATGTPKVANTIAIGAPMTLTVNGTGVCKYSLDIVKLENLGAPQPHLMRSSSLQTPFPITETIWATTPAGTYTFTVAGKDGCTGTGDVTVTAK